MGRATCLALTLAVSASGGCGIDWTVPEPSAEAGGAGGVGGAGGAAGPGGAGDPGSASSASAGVGGGGLGECDGTGDCNTCLACAQANPCGRLYQVCIGEPACAVIARCAGDCAAARASKECFDNCTAENPEGAAQFLEVFACFVCKSCPKDCAEAAGSCPGV